MERVCGVPETIAKGSEHSGGECGVEILYASNSTINTIINHSDYIGF